MEQEFKRIAIKVGSNVLTRKDGTLDITRMSALVDQIAFLHKKGIEIILISSGAIAAGRSEIHAQKKLDSLDQRQIYSAVGQTKLINKYYELFHEYSIFVGQVLTTKESFATRRHYLNQKNCMTVMLENNVIPIVNENDTIAVSELMFTDNDELSGFIASMMNVQALIILSNIDGIFNGAPSDPKSKILHEIREDENLSNYIQASKSSFGRGGMLTKTNIAKKVAKEGITVFIANGNRDHILENLLLHPDSTPCTRFKPSLTPVSNVKKWIAHSEGFAKGEIHIDQNATNLLHSNTVASILPIGITDVIGDFEKDDIVRIIDYQDKLIGVGKVNYNSVQTLEAMGKHAKRAIIHYDYLYIE